MCLYTSPDALRGQKWQIWSYRQSQLPNVSCGKRM